MISPNWKIRRQNVKRALDKIESSVRNQIHDASVPFETSLRDELIVRTAEVSSNVHWDTFWAFHREPGA